ncbi:secreted protein [Thioploca ingrica]|uniref:Secreted protein n=1 Tax=Thioploca ingrica TaxID=40754 RepID=A0A090BU30_9GAMM|nr:secreted protein [Thioploca ingrica]
MLTHIKIITVILLLLLFGCSPVIRHLDATWLNSQTVYKRAEPLPPLEIPPELASPRIPHQPVQ